MPRLLTIITFNSKIHSCDTRCYDATDENCNCICSGVNHGVGEVAARVNIYVHFPTIVMHILRNYPDVATIKRIQTTDAKSRTTKTPTPT